MARSILMACCLALAAANEEGLPWYEYHIKDVASYAAEACTHILTERSVNKWSDAGCASFVSEHQAEIMHDPNIRKSTSRTN